MGILYPVGTQVTADFDGRKEFERGIVSKTERGKVIAITPTGYSVQLLDGRVFRLASWRLTGVRP